MSNPFALDTPPASPAQPQTPAAVTAPVQPAQPTVPQQPAQPSVPAAAVGDDPFSGPAPQQPRGPRVRDMYGRLLLVIPHKVETVPNRLQAGTTQDRMTADVILLDGPCPYGGKPEAQPPIPHDKMASVPHKVARMYISGVGLISQCREALAKRQAGQPGMVLGRLGVGEAKEPGQNAPYLLQTPTDADKALARQYLATVDPFA